MTVAFYKAVHIVEAVFQKEGLNASTGHSERLRTLKRDRRFTKMHEHFRPLWQASTIARYLSNETGNDYRRFTDYMSAQDAENKMVRHRLHQLEESALGFLGPVGSEFERAIPRTH